MLALSLGVAWLLLAPLSLWLLIKGNTAERAAAVVTLLLLEGGTIAMDHLDSLRPAPVASVVTHHMAPVPACAPRTPAFRSARVGKALVLTWAAVARECDTAEVAVRTKGKRLLVWVRTGPDRPGAVPVRVRGDIAAVTVPLPKKSGHIPIDAQSGRRIPAPKAIND